MIKFRLTDEHSARTIFLAANLDEAILCGRGLTDDSFCVTDMDAPAGWTFACVPSLAREQELAREIAAGEICPSCCYRAPVAGKAGSLCVKCWIEEDEAMFRAEEEAYLAERAAEDAAARAYNALWADFHAHLDWCDRVEARWAF